MLCTVPGHGRGENSQQSALWSWSPAGQFFTCPSCLCVSFPARYLGKERDRFTLHMCMEHVPDGTRRWVLRMWNESSLRGAQIPWGEPLCLRYLPLGVLEERTRYLGNAGDVVGSVGSLLLPGERADDLWGPRWELGVSVGS